MLWGDMGLAPGEGPDACNGLTAERAATLRSTIPRGSYVADWHYLNNPDPEVYRKPLQIWKKNGNKPLASPWLWPNNVRGFALAAISEGAGVLQTTWADFESSEQNMLLNMEQFGAYVLALDYAWSGRSQLPANLPYDAVEQWAGRFYSQPKPVTNKKGFLVAESLQFSNITRTAEQGLPETMSMRLPALHSSGLRLQATTTNILPEGTPVAQLSLYYKGKMVYQTQLRYGVELRSKTDRRAIYAYTPGKEKNMLYRFFEKPAQADRIVLQSLHPGAGLTVAQLILIE
jgi:hypothetical protein